MSISRLEAFDDFLDDLYPRVDLGVKYLNWAPSDVLYRMDPDAYRQMKLEYEDMMEEINA